MLAALAQASPSTPYPAISGVAANEPTGGACSSVVHGLVQTPAQVQLTWAMAHVDTTNFETKVYENSILVATVTNDVLSWTKTITGAVSVANGGNSAFFTSNWTYRVDVSRKSDGSVVDSVNGPTWIELYGGCDG